MSKKAADPGKRHLPDLDIRKDIHLSVLKPSHLELKIICMRRNLTIQEVFEEFVNRVITGSPASTQRRSMRLSREGDRDDELVGLITQINEELARTETDPDARIGRLESLLRLTSEVLASYGANIYTLAMHQVQIIKQMTALEDTLLNLSRAKSPPLPAARPKAKKDDFN